MVEIMFRQGDVALVAMDSAEAHRVVDGAKLVERASGGLVLAYGEQTGHSHTIVRAGVKMYERGEERVIVSAVPFGVYHQEHEALKVPAGTYRVIRQREWTDDDEVRYVAD